MKLKNNLITTIYFILAVIAIVFAIICLATDVYSPRYIYTVHEIYGGDAYTGIQNAAADTSQNIVGLGLELGNLIKDCFGLSFILVGLIFIVLAIKSIVERKNIKEKIEIQPTIENN